MISLVVSILILIPGVYQPEIEEPPIETIEEIVIETMISIPELISNYSDIYNITDDVPLAIADAESNYLNECNKEYGCIAGIGIFQIVQSTFDEQCEGSPYEIKDNIDCGVKMIANGDYSRWENSMHNWLPNVSTTTRQEINTLCNCVTGIRQFGVNIPIGTDAKDLPSNSAPHVGAAVIFEYEDGLHHVGLIIEMTSEYMIILETNYVRCKETTRKIYFDDPSIDGFYDPKG